MAQQLRGRQGHKGLLPSRCWPTFSHTAVHASVQGFPFLQAVDLSFNRLSSLAGALRALAPLAGTLARLRLNDNILAPAAGAGEQAGGYQAAVLRALPLLRELDSQPTGAAGAQQLQCALAAVQQCPAVRPAAWQAADEKWDAHTVLWLLGDSGVAQEVQRVRAQQQALEAAAELQAGASSAPAAAGAEALAAALAGLQRAAAAGDAPPVATACSPLQQAQARYLLLAGDLSASQGLLLLEPAAYQRRLAALAAAATCIQASWRRCAARRLVQRLATERRARVQAAAAACIQAAWRGWVCRQRSHCWVGARLEAWRAEWREAQCQLLELQRWCAATCVQVGALGEGGWERAGGGVLRYATHVLSP